MRRFCALLAGLVLGLALALPTFALSVTGTLTSGISSPFNGYTAGQPFTVTVCDSPSVAARPLWHWQLLRSQDSGANWAPVLPPFAGASMTSADFYCPLSFDVTEPRSGIWYALRIYSNSGAAANYRFDQ